MNLLKRKVIFWEVVCMVFSFLSYASAQILPFNIEKLNVDYHETLKKIDQIGKIRVIVKLDSENKIDLSKGIPKEYVQEIQTIQGKFITKAENKNLKFLRKFKYSPLVLLRVNQKELNQILDDPDVKAVFEDDLSRPNLDDSTVLINADDVWAQGYTGANQNVAIVDTGVDKNHSMLQGKVVYEACFSTNDAGYDAHSFCPGEAPEAHGTGSAANCSNAIGGCDHGTHVAGIAAGNDDNYSGVAKGANIIATQVFTRFDDDDICDYYTGTYAPCILSFTSDTLAALEDLLDARINLGLSIAAINFSLTGTTYTSTCDASDSRTDTINALKSYGITTVAASGNDYLTNALGSPACISSVISVGSTNKSNVVSSFSNSASFLDLLAPGESITSAIPGGSYAGKSGTSMASPHVAGAIAVLRSADPSLSVDEIESALKATGESITDSRNGIIKPRIDLLAAFNEIYTEPETCLPGSRKVSDPSCSCAPPGSGDWTVSEACLADISVSPKGNVFVDNNSLLTIANGATLTVDLLSHYLKVKQGSGVLVKSGGKLYLTDDVPPNLLLHFDGTDGSTAMVDESGHTVTAVGNAQLDTAQKQSGTASLLLDASGDYLTIPDSDDFSFGANDFTIDFWMNSTTSGVTQRFIFQGTPLLNHALSFRIDQDNKLYFLSQTDAVPLAYYITESTVFISDGVWHHIEVVRNGTNFYIYVDGASQALSAQVPIGTNSLANGTTDLYIGKSPNDINSFNGWIDEFKIKTSAPVKKSKLLIHADGADGSRAFTETTGRHTIPAVGDAQIDTSTSHAGGASAYFDGSGDYLTIPDSDDWNFGTSDFAIDFWMKSTTSGVTQRFIFQGTPSLNHVLSFRIDQDNKLYFLSQTDAEPLAYYITESAVSIFDNVWHHIEVIRNGTNFYIKVDGNEQALSAQVPIGTNSLPNGTTDLYIGKSPNDINSFNGWMDELTITVSP